MTPLSASVLASGFIAGLMHPLSITAHVVALVGLGLMVGQQSRRRATLLAFAIGLVTGLAALAAAVGETRAPVVLLSGAALAGLAAASGWPVPGILGAPLALTIGTALGLDSPPRAASISAANAALVGTALAAFAAVALIAAIAARLRQGWPRVGVRVLGSWIAASAILVVTLALVR
jgi:hydrogenase/urease accessory protein HupE